MKKWIKVLLCSLGSLLGLVVVAVCVICWLVFTPAKLTAIVNDLSDKYLKCDASFNNVHLSLFKTFPYAGLKVSDAVLINPMEGADNDTLASVSQLVVGVDVKSFLRNGDVVVKELQLDGTNAYVFIDQNGNANYMVFPVSDDDDTSSAAMPELIDVKKLGVSNLSLSFCNLQAGVYASLSGLSLEMSGAVADSLVNADLSVNADMFSLALLDSSHVVNTDVFMTDFALATKLSGSYDSVCGNLDMQLSKADVEYDGQTFTNEAMCGRPEDLITVKAPFSFNLANPRVAISDASVALLSYMISLNGDVILPHQENPMSLDLTFATNKWNVRSLMSVLPDFLVASLNGMSVDADLLLNGSVKGVCDSTFLPVIDANVSLSKGRFRAPDLLPYKIAPLNADVDVHLNLADKSHARVNALNAHVDGSRLRLTGNVDDLLGNMYADAKLSGNVSLPILQKIIPDTVPIALGGTAEISLDVKASLNDVLNQNFAKVKLDGDFGIQNLDVKYDTIHAQSPSFNLAVKMPSAMNQDDVDAMISAQLESTYLKVASTGDNLNAQLVAPKVEVALNNILDTTTPLAMVCDLNFVKADAELDSTVLSTGPCTVDVSILYDSLQDNFLSQLNPEANLSLKGVRLSVPGINEAIKMSNLNVKYDSNICLVEQADLTIGNSDYHLRGDINNLESWISHKEMLTGDLYFSSKFANIDQMLDILSGMGTDEDTLAVQLAEDNIEQVECPFIVPKDVDFTLHTHINTTYAFGNRISDVQGDIRMRDGVVVLDEVGFVCDAARMQLTAIYKSPRPNHLFLGVDFHLLDIDVNSLVHLVPYIDTLVPMLSAFEGNGNFHIAAEMYMDHLYRPKQSTMRGAAAITGTDLVVMDNDVVKNIAQLLQLQDWRDGDGKLRVDSLDVEATLFRNEIEVYPFQLSLHKYGMVLAGRHTVDNKCNYHVELVKSPLPVRLAVDVKGDISQPKIELGKVQYAEFYKPAKQNAAQQQTLLIKQMIKQSLEDNVKEK